MTHGVNMNEARYYVLAYLKYRISLDPKHTQYFMQLAVVTSRFAVIPVVQDVPKNSAVAMTSFLFLRSLGVKTLLHVLKLLVAS